VGRGLGRVVQSPDEVVTALPIVLERTAVAAS
jgi:hypothetical protein